MVNRVSFLNFPDCNVSIILPFDEEIASRLVFVIVSGSDARKRFWIQLNNSKTVRDGPYLSIWS